LIAIVAALDALAACSRNHAVDCSTSEPDLVVCPDSKKPHVSNLSSGTVVVELTLRLDGSVSDARIMSSSGNHAWEDSILQAMQQWRYKQSDHIDRKPVPFDMSHGQ
jgi:TonB family protein